MVINKAVIFVCLALASVALAKHDAQGQLRGKSADTPPANKETPIVAAPEKVVEKEVEKEAAAMKTEKTKPTEKKKEKKKESTLNLKTTSDNVAREGLGENLPYPGVDYLGVGYYLLRGNPEGDKDTFVDPGFRLPVIELQWKQVDPFLSRDYQNLQPVGGWGLPETSCNQAQSSKTASSMEDYASELNVAASVSGGFDSGVASAEFSLSVESESFQQDVVEKNSERIGLTSYCLKYHVGLNKGEDAGFVPTANFLRRTKNLPKISQPSSCDAAGVECWDLKNSGNGKILTVKDGNLVFTDVSSSTTKWQFNSKSASTVVHIASSRAITFKFDAAGKAKVELADDDMGNKFTYNNVSEIMCANCQGPKNNNTKPGDKPTPRKHFSTLLRATKAGFAEAKDDKGNKDGVLSSGALKAGTHNKWELSAASADDEMAWSDFFQEFGTHFIDDLHLGGRMSFMVTITEDSKKALESAGLSVSAEVEAAYGVGSAGAEASMAAKNAANNELGKIDKEEKTIVLGGNPPDDPQTGFGQWAESVAEHPMPVKYTLRPLWAATKSTVDQATYDIMMDKYMNRALAMRQTDLRTAKFNGKGVGKNGTVTSGDPPTLRPGESWSSDIKEGVAHKETHFIITDSGSMVIKTKTDVVLWDSLSDDWGCKDKNCRSKTFNKPYTLTYQADGDLVLKDTRNKILWRSVTDGNTCNGKLAGKVVFDNGVLTIEDNTGKQHWTTATGVKKMGGDGAAQKAPPQFFGPGDNKCITKKNCITVWGEVNLKGSTKIQMAPNREYLYAELNAVGMNDYDYSISVAKGRCWLEAWENNDLTGYKDIFTENSVETTYLKGTSGLLTRQGSNDANSYRTHSTSDYQTYMVFKNYERDTNTRGSNMGGTTWGSEYYRPNKKLKAELKRQVAKRNIKMNRYFPTMSKPSAGGMHGGLFS